jgi:hypothetical protein
LSGLALSNLSLERTVLEVRYAKAFLLWDHAGGIGDSFQKLWPDLELAEAAPAKVTYRRASSEIVVELDKARVITHFPSVDLKDHIAIVKPFVESIQTFLQLREYTRIGLRLIYTKEFSNVRDATAAMLTLNKIETPSEKFFGLEGQPKQVELVARWENEKIGAVVRLQSETQKLEVLPPPAMKRNVEEVRKETHTFKYDVDYYTVASVNVAQWRVEDWINTVHHALKRDSHLFLGR